MPLKFPLPQAGVPGGGALSRNYFVASHMPSSTNLPPNRGKGQLPPATALLLSREVRENSDGRGDGAHILPKIYFRIVASSINTLYE